MKTCTYYQLKIVETGKSNPKEHTISNIINTEIINCCSIPELKEVLFRRYHRIPKGRTKIYEDDSKGNSFIVGFTHSFWNKDISHNSKSWFQTDWISIKKITEEIYLI